MELTIENLVEFFVKYAKGEFPNQRYGQAGCNYFNLLGDKYSNIFYEEDGGKASQLLTDLVIGGEYNES
jgi:hypothetical protein